jgi:hypothetical protein
MKVASGQRLLASLWLALQCAVAAATPINLQEIAGRYTDCGNRIIVLSGDGTARWEGSWATGGTDMVVLFSGTGRFQLDGEWIHMLIDPASVAAANPRPLPGPLAHELDRRFFPVTASGRTFLLDAPQLTLLVNSANRFHPRGQENTDCYLHREPDPAPRRSGPLLLAVEQLLPPEYLARLLPRPLAGEVEAVTGVTEQVVNVAGWMRPAEYKTQYTGRVRLNLGSRAGVFPGMRLYIGQPLVNEFVVDVVEANHSEGVTKWISSPPLARMPVSSARSQASR